MEKFVPDKSKFKDQVKGTYLTMMLFIETTTDPKRAIYSLSDMDRERRGVVYPSLRKLYLDMEDPSEYEFATKYLWGWEHWNRIVANATLFEYIRLWREELEIRLRAKGINSMIRLVGKDNFNAAKWVADGHWNVKRGRPSKEEIERERNIRNRAMNEADDESNRVVDLVQERKNRGKNPV